MKPRKGRKVESSRVERLVRPVELDPRYIPTVKLAMKSNDCEPLKTLFAEYNEPWIDSDFSVSE